MTVLLLRNCLCTGSNVALTHHPVLTFDCHVARWDFSIAAIY
jgi:hypothetical protein